MSAVLPSSEKSAPKIGRDAGWLLSFHREDASGTVAKPVLEFGRDDYYAQITAVLPGGLDGGGYTFVVEGLTDAHYAAIALANPEAPRIVRLYLFYRDAADGGILSNVLGADVLGMFSSGSKAEEHAADLVAELAVQSVTRRAGARTYETTITARELVYDRVVRRRPYGDAIGLSDPSAALTSLMRCAATAPGASVPSVFHAVSPRTAPPLPEAPADPEPPAEFADQRQPIAAALNLIATRLERSANRFGRGMLLVRDGCLHVGQRPIPLHGTPGQPLAIGLSDGLLQVEALEPIERDPDWEPEPGSDAQAPTRAQFRLTLRGRPDLKPGDLVVVDVPAQDASSTKSPLGGAFGALGDLAASIVESVTGNDAMANPVALYVSSAEHRLGRDVGFTTTLTGVQVEGSGVVPDDELWDAHTPTAAPRDPVVKAPRGTVERDAADAVVRLVRRETARLHGVDIGEIRAFRTTSSGADAAQTSEVFRGLVPTQGANASRRADIRRPSGAPASGVPYLTPFAWGRCGLVLPRYPGMRVALGHHQHDGADPIDFGALWQTGHLPANAQPGDWWLSLPAKANAVKGNAPGEAIVGPPADYSDEATHDLTDAAGNRVIAVGALVVRIGTKSLPRAGERPDPPPAPDSVTIEHPEAKAKIEITSDGTITISGKNLVFEAKQKITMKAAGVDIE